MKLDENVIPHKTLGHYMASRKKPLVVISRKLPDSVETRMCELFDTRLNLTDKPLSPAELAEAVKTADVLVPTVTDRIDADLIVKAGPQLKLIANFGNGVDNIDVTAATARGIIITNTPKVLTEDTADMTMALILSVPRRLAEGATVLTGDKDWAGWTPTWMLGHRLGGKRLGIIGMGRIGRAVAKRAKAFGVQIHYHNRRRVQEDIERELEEAGFFAAKDMRPTMVRNICSTLQRASMTEQEVRTWHGIIAALACGPKRTRKP